MISVYLLLDSIQTDRFPVFHPFIKIEDRFSAFQCLVHRVESASIRNMIPVRYNHISLAYHVFVPAKLAAVMVVLGNHHHPVRPFQQTGIQQLVFRIEPQGLFPEGYCRY